MDTDTFHLTQEMLASLLAIKRTTATLSASVATSSLANTGHQRGCSMQVL